MRVALIGLLFALGCAAGSPVIGPPGATVAGAASCPARSVEIWAIDMNYMREAGATRPEVVRKNAEVHFTVEDPAAAERLAVQFDKIASRPCGRDCSEVDHRLVARFSGPSGCVREFVASRDYLFDLTSRKFGEVGEGFRNVFRLDVGANCDSTDAVIIVQRDAERRGIPEKELEERDFTRPLTWSEFRRARPRVASEIEKDVGPELSRRYPSQVFYYVRFGRKGAEGTPEDWTHEAVVFPDDCTLVRVRGAR